MEIDINDAPIGSTHYYSRGKNLWFYKKNGSKVFYPNEEEGFGWIEHEFGIDVEHDKWLDDNLKPIVT